MRATRDCRRSVPNGGKPSRPRDSEVRRAYARGVESLGDVELLGFLFGRTGAAGRSAVVSAPLDSLARASAPALEARFGVGPRDAVRIASAFELGRRSLAPASASAPSCQSAASVYRIVAPLLAGRERERFVALLLDGKHRLRRVETISEGTLTTSLVHPREVFAIAIREAAAAIVVAHNHPSGDPEPSAEDLAVTRRLRRVGRLVGIPLVDHLVVGRANYVSLRERLW